MNGLNRSECSSALFEVLSAIFPALLFCIIALVFISWCCKQWKKRAQETKSNGRQKAYRPFITRSILENADYGNVAFSRGPSKCANVIISKRRFISDFQNSCDAKLPLIPCAVYGDTEYWPDWVQIVYIASKGIYVGIKYGYDEEELSLIARFVKDALPTDLITIIIQYSMEVEFKSFILQQPLIGNVKYNKWAASIEVRDFEQEYTQIANYYNINLDAMRRCFNENDVDYSYFEHHSRREFIHLLRGYGIKAGPAIKVFQTFISKM